MTDWAPLIPDAPFDWVLIPLDGRKRPIDPSTGRLLEEWQNQPGYDVEELSQLNGCVKAVGLKLGPPSGGVLAVDFDGPHSLPKFQEIYGRKPTDLPPTVGVTSGKPSRGQRFFLVDQDWWPHLRGRRFWKGPDGEICLELRWVGHQSVIAGAHPETGSYRWLPNSSPADQEIAQAPDWLLEPLLLTEKHAEPFEPTSDDAKRAVAMLECINPLDRTSYDDWLEVGMALFHTDPGLLSNWVEWSKAMPNFDEAECLNKWESFGTATGSRLTIRSLHHWAKQGGYREPKRTTKQPASSPYAPFTSESKPAAQPSGVAQGAIPSDDDDDDENAAIDRELSREAHTRFLQAQEATIDLTEVFGPIWGQLLIDRAAAFPCDPSMLLLPMLGYIASLVGTKATVKVKTGWSEALVIWGLIAQPASSLKSPAGGVFGKPLAKLQGAAQRDYDKYFSTFQVKERKWKADCRRIEAAAKKEGASPELPEPPTPPQKPRHYFVDSVTIERLAAIQSQDNVPGTLSFHDELADWFSSLERNSKTTDRAKWLKLWNGGPLKHDTLTSASSFAESTAVSIVGFIQPDKLAALHAAEEDSDQDTSGDGLWARFLPLIPRTIPFAFNDLEVDITDDLMRLAARLDEISSQTTLLIHPAAIRDVLSPAWARWVDLEKDSGGSRAAFIGKLRGYSVRLSGILHLLHEHLDNTIAMPTAITAVRLCDFFLAQFDLLAPQITPTEDVATPTARFLAKVHDTGLQEVRVRDFQRWKTLGRSVNAKQAHAFLQALADQGIGTFEQLHTKGSKRGSWAWKPSPLPTADAEPSD